MSMPPNSNAQFSEGGQVKTVKVWDFPTRIFHWAMALVVGVAWVSSEGSSSIFSIHVYAGTLLLGFVVFRAIWGVIGSRHALFTDFVRGPDTVKDYAKRLMIFRPPHMVGHNPLGGWMVMALLAIIVLSVISGLMAHKGSYVGPLAHIGGGWFGETHGFFVNLLGFLIFAHVAGVFIHGFISSENLPRAMITGDKEVPADAKAENIKPVGFIRPVLALLVSIAVVYYFMR